jgi:hypothetical protein
MEDHHEVIVHGCDSQAVTAGGVGSRLDAELCANRKPGRCLTQVDR